MLDLKEICEKTQVYKDNLSKRGFDCSVLDTIVSLDEKRKKLIHDVEKNRSEVKNLSKEIGPLKKAGKDATELMNKVSHFKKSNEKLDEELHEVQNKQRDLLLAIPNCVSDDTPFGKSEEENLEIFRKGTPKIFDFQPIDHATLGEKLGMLDFETAAKTTGSRFVFYRKKLARLERALINFMLDQHEENGYEEIQPPVIVHERSLVGTGQLPKFKDDLFKLEGHDYYLIPTAEVPLTNLKREDLFDKKELPIKVTAFTPCFRSEAGSYGKDTRGLIRLHQFNKVELVNIVEASKSIDAHEDMVERACSILDLLDLPYRGVVLCSGDIGFGAKKTVDLEVWLPSQNTYREISSISNCGDFQARRAGIRYRNNEGKPEFAHTLNGSGLAVGRTLVAIMENYQNKDGSITIPLALRPYMDDLDLIKA